MKYGALRIALVGRPNVGKSTLFNRLIGQKNAIVGDVPGITRDRKSLEGDFFGIRVCVTDTPGVDTFSKNELAKSMNEQSDAAVAESDIVFFVVDAIEGATAHDKAVAVWLRNVFKKHGNKPVVIIKNKSERNKRIDFYDLGFGEGISVSAAHNIGMDGIFDILNRFQNEQLQSVDNEHLELTHCESCSHTESTQCIQTMPALKIAILGRPNVGKSSLVNAIIGENRLLTGDMSGITRDSISLNWRYKGRLISLIDTAGQRKRAKVCDKIEQASVANAWHYAKQSNVIIVVTDINNALERQDIIIAKKAFDEGKIIIFALNKSDTVDDAEAIRKKVEDKVKYEFAQVPGVPCLLVSARERLGLARIFNVAFELYDKWTGRISTGELNKWFQKAITQNPPPLTNGMPIKMKYISQTSTKPPTFTVFANRAEHLPLSYKRYLLNQLSRSFSLNGIPLRIFVRQRENPFAM